MKTPKLTRDGYGTISKDLRRKPRRFLLRRALIGIVFCFVFVITIFVLLIGVNLRRYSPPSKHGLNPGASGSEPGYGFDLSTGYGTAAIRHGNGSTTTIGKVSASREYVEMMKRSSKKDTSLTGVKYFPCYPYTWAAFPDLYRWPVYWRSIRKRIGLPATTDVALLADLLKSLHEKQAQKNPGFTAKSAVVTFPDHQSLYQEDITDALEYLDILLLTSRQLDVQPHQISAAYAGYGMGLCQTTTDLSKCMTEQHSMAVNITLAVSLTHDALTVETYAFQEVYQYSPPNIYADHPVDYDLGLDE